jgi:hypothetical protein
MSWPLSICGGCSTNPSIGSLYFLACPLAPTASLIFYGRLVAGGHRNGNHRIPDRGRMPASASGRRNAPRIQGVPDLESRRGKTHAKVRLHQGPHGASRENREFCPCRMSWWASARTNSRARPISEAVARRLTVTEASLPEACETVFRRLAWLIAWSLASMFARPIAAPDLSQGKPGSTRRGGTKKRRSRRVPRRRPLFGRPLSAPFWPPRLPGKGAQRVVGGIAPGPVQ